MAVIILRKKLQQETQLNYILKISDRFKLEKRELCKKLTNKLWMVQENIGSWWLARRDPHHCKPLYSNQPITATGSAASKMRSIVRQLAIFVSWYQMQVTVKPKTNKIQNLDKNLSIRKVIPWTKLLVLTTVAVVNTRHQQTDVWRDDMPAAASGWDRRDGGEEYTDMSKPYWGLETQYG